MAPTRPNAPSRIQGDLNGGLTGALISVTATIGFGLILYAPFGFAGVGPGIVAILLGQVVGGALGGVASGTRGLSVGTTSAMTLLLAGLVQTVAVTYPGPDGIGIALAAVALATLLCGFLLMLLALLGVGKIIPLVPYPVLAGLVNGTAALLVVSMTWRAIGPGPGTTPGLWLPVSPLVAGAVILVMFMRLPRWLAQVPAVLLAVLVGTALHHALALIVGLDHAGPMLGAMPSVAAGADSLLRTIDTLGHTELPLLARLVVPVAVTMALVAMIETLAATSALEDTMGRVPYPRRDLIVTGLANVANSLVGAAAVSASAPGSLIVARAGGTTWLALVLRSALLLFFVVVLAPVLAVVPMAAMAGVLIATGLRLLDLDGLVAAWRVLRAGRWHRIEVICGGLIIMVVAGVAIRWSLVAAVAVGVPLSIAVFVAAMGHDLVRRAYRSPIGRSRLRWPEQETATLIAAGGRIAVIEVAGAIFFGSVDMIARRIAAERAGGAEYIVLDMRGISSIDLSGARRLTQTCGRLWQEGVHLSLAYMRPGLAIWDYLEELSLLGRLKRTNIFPSLDTALAAVETDLLTASGTVASDDLAPEAALRGLGLPAYATATILPLLTEIHYETNDMVMRAGEVSRTVFLLLSGRLEVTIPLAAAGVRTRLATVTPGTLVGEMALLSGAPRSADVIARSPSVCLRFDAATVALLRRDHPDTAYHLLTCIALQIDRNLRLANMTIASLEG